MVKAFVFGTKMYGFKSHRVVVIRRVHLHQMLFGVGNEYNICKE
jgi:hypothetical protein